MQFTTSAAAFLALMSHALAQTSGFDAVTKPTSGEVLTAGSTYQVTWDYNSQYDGTISITLLQGDTDTTLEVGDTVASAIDNSAGSYSWTVGSDLGEDATYGLKITLDSDPSTFQYSFPFKIVASGEGSSSSSSSISAATVSTSASSALSSSAAASSTISMASSSSSVSSTVSDTPTTESATVVSVITSTSPTATDVTKSASTGTMVKTTLTSVASATSIGSSTGSGTSSSASAIVTAGAGKVVAGTFVAMGGLAAALLAL